MKYDVVIIGGSYAGLSAAMCLGRSLRNTMVIDAGSPCNRTAPYSHNFLTQDGIRPSDIQAKALEQVMAYPTVSFYQDSVVNAEQTESGFIITTKDESIFAARKLLIATGIQDQLLPVIGFKDCWGISIIHCPYCHGYEYRAQRTGVILKSDLLTHLLPLLMNLTREIFILTNGDSIQDQSLKEQLLKAGVLIIETPIKEVLHENGHIRTVLFEDGELVDLSVIYAPVPFQQQAKLIEQLGCVLTKEGYIEVDLMQRTTVPGVFAAGDNTSMMRSVANAVAAGNMAGAMINKELANEDFVFC